MPIKRIKMWLSRRLNTIMIFAYGLIIGTSAPLFLTRCASSGGNCGNCAGFCSLALGVLPLVAFFTFREKLRHLGQSILSKFSLTGK